MSPTRLRLRWVRSPLLRQSTHVRNDALDYVPARLRGAFCFSRRPILGASGARRLVGIVSEWLDMPGLQGDSCRRGRVVLALVTMLAEGLRSLTGLSSLPLGACSMGSGWGVGVLHEGLSLVRHGELWLIRPDLVRSRWPPWGRIP